MKTRWIVTIAATTAIGGCTCRKSSEPVRRDDDAAPIADAKSPAEPDRERFEIIGADVVDLAQRKVVHTLAERPTEFAVDAGGAYVWSGHRLDALDLPSGRARWSYDDLTPAQISAPILVDDRYVYVAWSDRAFSFDRATGTRGDLVTATPGKTINDAALYGDAYVVGFHNTSVAFVDLTERKVRWELIPSSAMALAMTKRGPIGLSLDTSSTIALGVRAWSPRGEVLFDARIGASPGTSPPMGIGGEIPGYFLLSGRAPGTHSVILSLKDGSIAFELARPIVAATVDASGALEWAFEPTKASTVQALDAKTTTPRWSATFGCSTEVIQVATTERALFFVGYSRATGGGCLLALDRKSGVVLWQQPLDDAKVPHSEYWNEVSLRVRDDTLVVVGREAGAEYLEVLDAATGDKRFDHLVRF